MHFNKGNFIIIKKYMAPVWNHLFEGMSSIKLILGKISGVLAVDIMLYIVYMS